jgi:hypothetical protein
MAAAATPQQMLETWLSMDTDPASRESMEQLAHDQNWNELEDLLCKRLEFGTAGGVSDISHTVRNAPYIRASVFITWHASIMLLISVDQ